MTSRTRLTQAISLVSWTFYSPAAIDFADGEPVIDRNVGKAIASRWRKTIGSNRAHMAIRVEEVDVSLATSRTITRVHLPGAAHRRDSDEGSH